MAKENITPYNIQPIDNFGAKLIVIPEGKVCDYIDGKFRPDTPEEYVRQNVEKRLVNECCQSAKWDTFKPNTLT